MISHMKYLLGKCYVTNLISLSALTENFIIHKGKLFHLHIYFLCYNVSVKVYAIIYVVNNNKGMMIWENTY